MAKTSSNIGSLAMFGKIFTALAIVGWILLAVIVIDCLFFNSKLIIGVLSK